MIGEQPAFGVVELEVDWFKPTHQNALCKARLPLLVLVANIPVLASCVSQ
jgi:hypothetical protein